MPRPPGSGRLTRRSDGLATGVWRGFTLRSAFQPIFAFSGGRLGIVAYEGLLRPFRDGEPVGAAAFLAAAPAEERLHVETLARSLHLINAGAVLDPAAAVFVNFDPSLFVDRQAAELALRATRLALREAGIAPGRVVCELTEQKSASRAALSGLVEALRALGLRIAVDDYGSDESDIRRIEELRPDIVKFDAALVARLMDTAAGFGLLKTMVATFEARGVVAVLEGIERRWQIELAERSGAAMVQGYALARPELASAARVTVR